MTADMRSSSDGGRRPVRRWVATAGAVVLALGLVGAIGGPVFASQAALSAAVEEHASSYDSWRDAVDRRAEAEIGFDAAYATSSARYADAKALADAVPAAMLASSAPRDELLEAVAAFGSSAGLAIDSTGTVAARTDVYRVPTTEVTSTSTTAAEYIERARELDASAAELTAESKDTWGRAVLAYDAADALPPAELGLLTALSASSTAWPVPAKASVETRDAYARASDALAPEVVGEGGKRVERAAAYVAARLAVQQSHDAVVAAEAAEAAARSRPSQPRSTVEDLIAQRMFGPLPPSNLPPFVPPPWQDTTPPRIHHNSYHRQGCPTTYVVGDSVRAGFGGYVDVAVTFYYTVALIGDTALFYRCTDQ